MVGANLLWIHHNDEQPARRREAAAARRQHVMLDFIEKQETSRRFEARKAREDKSLLSQAGQKEGQRLSLFYDQQLKPALVLAEDSEIYRAAWWHSLNICFTEQHNGWMDTCRSEWGQRFWNLAREDGTLREMFLSYAAAKEAAVKRLPYSKPYLVHKGRAIQLVAKDLQKEGRELRIAAVATMCLLAKSAFIEEEYEAGEAHVRAITAVVESRLNEFPAFVWLLVVWADLRLTGVSSRAPVMPYGLHPDFAEAQLPLDLREKAGFLGGCNMISLPSFSVTAAEKTTLLLQKLHELALAYNAPKEMNWTPVWVVTYDAAYMLAEMKHEVYSIEEVENGGPYSIDKVVLLAAGIQMWSTLSQFIPVPGFLRYGVEELTECLSNLEPQTMVDHWIACSGKLDSLLWVFFNASAAAIRLCFVGKLSPSSMPRWLWLGLRYIISTMSISMLSSFVETLRPFPFANDWNERTSKIVWLWMKTGFVMPDDLESEKRRQRSYFASLRLTFDAEVVERVRKEEENRMVTAAHEMLLAGE